MHHKIQRSRGFLFDLDGTLVIGGRLLAGVAETLCQLEGRFVIVSNNSTHTPDGLAVELARIGLHVPPERIVLAGDLALKHVKNDFPASRLLLFASPAMQDLADRLGLIRAKPDEVPDIVLLLRDETFGYEKLYSAVNAVRRGALLIASNPDISHPGPDGTLVPETGAFLQSLLSFPNITLHRIIGKPESDLLLEGARLLEVPPEQCLMVGDNPSTDGAGAIAAGMAFHHVAPSLDAIPFPKATELIRLSC